MLDFRNYCEELGAFREVSSRCIYKNTVSRPITCWTEMYFMSSGLKFTTISRLSAHSFSPKLLPFSDVDRRLLESNQ